MSSGNNFQLTLKFNNFVRIRYLIISTNTKYFTKIDSYFDSHLNPLFHSKSEQSSFLQTLWFVFNQNTLWNFWMAIWLITYTRPSSIFSFFKFSCNRTSTYDYWQFAIAVREIKMKNICSCAASASFRKRNLMCVNLILSTILIDS